MTTTNMSTPFFSSAFSKSHCLIIFDFSLFYHFHFLRLSCLSHPNLARALILFFLLLLVAGKNTYPSCLAASFCLQKSWGCFGGKGKAFLVVVVVAKTHYTHIYTSHIVLSSIIVEMCPVLPFIRHRCINVCLSALNTWNQLHFNA